MRDTKQSCNVGTTHVSTLPVETLYCSRRYEEKNCSRNKSPRVKMRDRRTDGDYDICRISNAVISRHTAGKSENSRGSRTRKRTSRIGGDSCSSVAEKLSWLRSKFQEEGRRATGHDVEEQPEQGCLLLQQVGMQALAQQHHQQHRDEETHTLLQLRQQKRVKARQQHSMLNWRSGSRLSQHRYASAQHPHRRLQEYLKQQGRGYRQREKKQGKQQQSEGEERKDGEEEREDEENDQQVATRSNAAFLHMREEMAQELYLPKRPVDEYYRLRESSMVWPLQRQDELMSVELTGGCCFQEAAVHGQDRRPVVDSHASHFQQRPKQSVLLATAQSLPSIESATFGRRTTTPVEQGPVAASEGQERGGHLTTDAEEEEEETEDDRGRASFSMVLRPNVLASLRSRSASSGVGAGSFSLRSLVSGDSFRRGYAARRERGERVAAEEVPWEPADAAAKRTGVSPEADETAVRGDVGGAVPADAGTGRAATDRTSFIATATDAGSVYRKSAVSACCYWNKRIWCSRTRWHYLIFLSIYAYLIGPVYLNWAPLREILFRSGAYAWECDPDERDPSSLRYISAEGGGDGSSSGGSPAACTLQRLRVGNLYTVCAAADFGFSFFGGLVVDWLGPKTGSLLGSTSMLAGWLLLALSSESVNVYIPGMVLFGIGIDMAFYGTLSVSRLFPGHANIVIAAIVGMRGLGLMSPLILNAIRLPFTAVMLGYALGGLLPAVLIASVYAPWKPFQADSLKKKKRRKKKGTEPLLSADGGIGSSGHALETASPHSHDSAGSPKVAAQETAADLFYTEEAADTNSARPQQQQLLDGTIRERLARDPWQQQSQKEQQLLEPKQEETRQHPPVGVSAVSSEVAGDKTRQLQGFRPLAAEDKQRLLQQPAAAAEAGDEHESHLNIIYGEAIEEGWLSDTGNDEEERARLFSPVSQLQQERPDDALDEPEEPTSEQHVSDHEQVEQGSSNNHNNEKERAAPRETLPHDPVRSNTISSASPGTDSRTVAAHSSSYKLRPGDFFADIQSSSPPAQEPPDTAAAAAPVPRTVVGGRIAIADGRSAAGTASGMRAGHLDKSCMQRQLEVEERKSARRVSVLLQQQQAHSKELTGTPRTLPQVRQAQQTEGAETWRGAQGSNGEEEQQQGQSGGFPGDSTGSSRERLPPQLFTSRRTRSTAADEESTGTWGTGNGKAHATERSVLEEKREQQELHVQDPEGVGTSESPGPRGVAATASSAAASSETPGNSTAAAGGESVELCEVVTTKAGAAAAVGEQDHDDMRATTLEKHIPLRRPLSSRQFPRTCAGRLRYFVAYLQQHPWTVSSVAFLRNYLFTLVYFPVVPYFAFSLMRSVYFSDASEDLVPSAIGTLHVLLACVCVVPPITGLLADMWTIMPCLVLINTTGTIVMLGSLLAHLTNIVAFEYIAVIFYMPFAAVLTNQVYFYVADAFPQRHLGKLCGFACSIGGVASLSVTSMFEFSVKREGGFTIMLSIMLGISLLCYGFILLLYIGQKRLKRQNAAAAAAAAALELPGASASQHPLPRSSTATLAPGTTAAASGPAEQGRAAAAVSKKDRLPSAGGGGGAVPVKNSPLETVEADGDWLAGGAVVENSAIAGIAARAGVGH